jgi:hypothetical protein
MKYKTMTRKDAALGQNHVPQHHNWTYSQSLSHISNIIFPNKWPPYLNKYNGVLLERLLTTHNMALLTLPNVLQIKNVCVFFSLVIE